MYLNKNWIKWESKEKCYLICYIKLILTETSKSWCCKERGSIYSNTEICFINTSTDYQFTVNVMFSYMTIQLIKCFGRLIWLTIKYMYLGYYYILHGANCKSTTNRWVIIWFILVYYYNVSISCWFLYWFNFSNKICLLFVWLTFWFPFKRNWYIQYTDSIEWMYFYFCHVECNDFICACLWIAFHLLFHFTNMINSIWHCNLYIEAINFHIVLNCQCEYLTCSRFENIKKCTEKLEYKKNLNLFSSKSHVGSVCDSFSFIHSIDLIQVKVETLMNDIKVSYHHNEKAFFPEVYCAFYIITKRHFQLNQFPTWPIWVKESNESNSNDDHDDDRGIYYFYVLHFAFCIYAKQKYHLLNIH